MVKYESDVLDAVFAALAHPTRRKVLQTLEQGSLSVGELAEPHGMSLPGFMKHLRVLEDAGLVTRTKDGRVVNLVISPEPMHEAAVWLSRYDKFWSERLGALGRYLYQEEELNPPMEDGSTKDRPSVTFTRHYNVAPEKVWRAWTDPKTLAQWFGPDVDGVVSVADMDVRVGGEYHIVFGVPGGEQHDVSGVYQEVVRNRKLVFSWSWKSTPERVSLVTVTLRPSSTGTELTFVHEKFHDQAARDSHNEGWAGAFAKLDPLLT